VSRVEIHGAQYTVGELFGPAFAFTVPAFQRPYAWTCVEATALFQDLLDVMGDTALPVRELPPYFLGSIVLVREEEYAPDVSIVDGQQRLTTLTILLAAIRALADPRRAPHLNRHLYEEGSPFIDSANAYRLRLRSRDATFFQRYVQEPDGLAELPALDVEALTDSQRNIRANTLAYLEALRELPEERRFRFAQYVLTRCLLLAVATPDLDAAYHIFSVLNNRGLDLSYADILKAQLFGKMPDAQRDGYMARWEEVEDALGRKGFEALFRHMRMIEQRKKAQGSILREFRDYITAFMTETGKDDWHVIDERIVPQGLAMYAITHAAYEPDHDTQATNATLKWLNLIPNADWLPPAIAFLTRYHDQPAAVADFFRDLERLAVSLMLRRFNESDRIKRYAGVLERIKERQPVGAKDSRLQLTVDEREATVRALNGSLANLSAQPCKYLLRRLDALLADAAPDVYPEVTVEHVLPLNPASNGVWSQWYKDAKVRKQYEYRLGNLALLPEGFNRKAANADFAQKRVVYASATHAYPVLALAGQARDANDWTPATVDRRQHELLARLRSLWRL
jgi:uncharacterized protein DUF262/uncharacterized protein DUF1524